MLRTIPQSKRGEPGPPSALPRRSASVRTAPEGWQGWDDYAAFYDWENARTLGRRDVAFWRTMAAGVDGPVLELGCGTGRVTLPLGRAGVEVVGIDRSVAMLDRARTRVRRAKLGALVRLVRGDIRYLPFKHPAPRRGRLQGAAPAGPFAMVMAPYGVLQSLLRERDLARTLDAVHGVLAPGGTFGLEMVADLPTWEEYRRRTSLKGWRTRAGGTHVTLVESVRQDRARGLTIFDQEFTERRGRERRVHQFALTFRTLSVPQMVRRLVRAGFEVTARLGDYRGGPWRPGSEVWVIVAKKC
jgi:SAM-dependent methyltransferase